MDNNTKEVLQTAGKTVKDLTLGLVKFTFGTLKYISQEVIDLCDNCTAKKENKPEQ